MNAHNTLRLSPENQQILNSKYHKKTFGTGMGRNECNAYTKSILLFESKMFSSNS